MPVYRKGELRAHKVSARALDSEGMSLKGSEGVGADIETGPMIHTALVNICSYYSIFCLFVCFCSVLFILCKMVKQRGPFCH